MERGETLFASTVFTYHFEDEPASKYTHGMYGISQN